MKEITLREFQLEELKILKKLDEICQEQKIHYWVMYGTLLGAVRHKGFIPWDDDVDLAMPRKDFERFMEYIQEHPESIHPLVLDSYETNKGYPFYIPRICNPDYFLTFENRKYTSGLFVDIYPFDGMGNSKEYWHRLYPKILRIRKHLTLSTQKSLIYGSGIAHKVLNLPNSIYSKIRGNQYFLRKLDHIEKQFSWDESKYVSVPAWDPQIWFFEKEWFDCLIRVPFEDTYACIPKKYDEVLKTRYGDYMQLPPKEEQKPHHGFRAFRR